MEPITYTLPPVKSGTVRHDDDDISRTTVSLFTDGSLWAVVVEENWMSSPETDVYRATDEIRHQAVEKACIRANNARPSRSYNVYQIYEALGIEVLPGGIVVD